MPDNLILSNDSRNNAKKVFKSLLELKEPLLVIFHGVDSNNQYIVGQAEITAGCTIYPEVKIIHIGNGQHWVGEFVKLEYREANPKIFRIPMLHFLLYPSKKNAKKYDQFKSYHIFLTELTY